jgi:hypothetical protein
MFTSYVNRWASRFGSAFVLIALLGLGLTVPKPAKAAGLALEQCTGLLQLPGVRALPTPPRRTRLLLHRSGSAQGWAVFLRLLPPSINSGQPLHAVACLLR